MAMVSVIATIARASVLNPIPLYWALSLGGCLEGNGTLVGTSANVVVVDIAERHGYTISFKSFIKYGISGSNVNSETSINIPGIQIYYTRVEVS